METVVQNRPTEAEKRGEDRELCVWRVLDFLKNKNVIEEYVPSSHLDAQDCDGIDITIIAIGPSKRRVYPLQVTGPLWVEKHYVRNPETPVVIVDLQLGAKTMWRFALAQVMGMMALENIKESRLICDYRISPKFWWIDRGITTTFTVTLPTSKISMRQIHLVHLAEESKGLNGEDEPLGILYIPHHQNWGQDTVQAMVEMISKKLGV